MMKTGILLAAFGSSSETARRSLTGFESRVRMAFPDVPVRWAYTSGIIRHRLAGEGTKTDSTAKALKKMWFEKYTHVAVQSLHVVPGKEFNALRDEARSMLRTGDEDGFADVQVGTPLLDTEEDVARVARAVERHAPSGRGKGDALILMGHGTWHAGDSRYDDLARVLAETSPDTHIATMDGNRTLPDILPALAASNTRRAYLMPLLAVAGGHVRRDMAGTGPDSWCSLLRAHGVEPVPVLKGAAEYPGFADIWLDHLDRAMRSLSR